MQLNTLSKFAFEGIQQGKLVFDDSSLNDYVSLGLLNSLHCFTTTGEAAFFQFLHLTIQEFLAARYVASDAMTHEERKSFLRSISENETYRMTLLFFADLSRSSFSSDDSLLQPQSNFLPGSNEKENTESPFIISIEPKDVCCKPGEKVEFTISTAPSATTYQWYFKNQAISLPDYEGQTSERLLVSKYLPKHRGAYWCVAGDGSGTQITSRHAALTAGNLSAQLYTCNRHVKHNTFYMHDVSVSSLNSFLVATVFHTDGEKIEKQELQFIGKMLNKSAIDFGKYGIETVLLLNGESDVTYKEMEFVMNLNLRTQVLSNNLKQEITSSKNQL